MKEPIQGYLLPPEEADLKLLHGWLLHLQGNLQALMKHVGRPDLCKGCGAQIIFIRHLDSGRFTPYELDGTNHFINCPDAPQFKRKKEEQQWPISRKS